MHDAAARSRLFEAVTWLVQVLARRAPIALLLDDLHWADTASLDLLLYAASRWTGDSTPLLLLVNLRGENLATHPALAHWLANLGRELPLTRLALSSLTVEDTQHCLMP